MVLVQAVVLREGSRPCAMPSRKRRSTWGVTVIEAVGTVWVIIAGVLVIFMQAGFALLEAGLCRMKNAAHIAVKNLIVLGVVAVTYWAVGYGLAFGKGGNALFGGSGFFPGSADLLSYTSGPYDWRASASTTGTARPTRSRATTWSMPCSAR